ncbi:MAG: apolipoprotein N-acyltransferase [Treponemataceae bacterium]
MSFLNCIVLSVLSSVVFAFALPNEVLNFGSSVLGFLALIPLYAVFSKAKNRKTIAVCFGIWVALVHLMGSFWLGFFKDYAIFTLGASSVAYFVLASAFAPAFYEALHLKNKNLRPLFFAIVLVFWEWFKSNGFLGYPWGTLEMTAFNAHWLKQIADITGVWGISFVIAFTSASFAQVILSITEELAKGKLSKDCVISQLRVLACVCFLCFVSGLYSFVSFKKPLKQVDSLKVAIVQPNSNSWEPDYEKKIKELIDLTESLLVNSENPDLIIWNEGSLPCAYPLSLVYYFTTPENYTFVDFMLKNETPLLAGTAMPVAGSENSNGVPQFFTNSVCLISPEAEVLDTYAKAQLVPFAEYMPFIEKPFVQKFFKSLVGFSSGYLPGKNLNLISLRKKDGGVINFSAPICFEDAFPSLCASLHNLGSELMINLTDDSWSRTDSAEYQHFIVASFRTIELRTTLIRSANAGYSCVIDPKGEVTSDLPLFTSAGLYADVPIYEYTTTFYTRFKDWLPIICYLLTLALPIWKFLSCKFKLKKSKEIVLLECENCCD